MFRRSSLLHIFVAGLAYAVLAQFFHSFFAYLSFDFYTNDLYSHFWSQLMMPQNGPPPAAFFFLSFFFSFVIGSIFVLTYRVIENSLCGESFLEKGLCFGILLFLVSGIPMFLFLFLLLALPVALIWIWALETFILYLLAGILIARLSRFFLK
ncbi:hypothetical protein HYV56_02345 [Candidatus Peregrinibacteria bacterium]|nr:hypothetical protein [Candidatus Peregrinibacteria bacterium]